MQITAIRNLDKKTIINCLRSSGEKQQELFSAAKKICNQTFHNKIHFRGIIEFSNICQNNCFYCGIRKDNLKLARYQMTLPEIKRCLDFIKRAKYGSVVFQSGELRNKNWQKYLLDIVKFTKNNYPKLGITVSCGEQSYEFYKKLRQAGAMRYLLRIETANPLLYSKLHPKNMSWQKRWQCLTWLKELDYQVGTGIMIGLPGQTVAELYDTLAFFKQNEFDMYGLGPYVIHDRTPLATPAVKKSWRQNKDNIFNLTMNFLAVLRIILPKVNIAAATALDVFDPLGRIKALKVGANIIMPSVTPLSYRKKYLLYKNKPCLDEEAKHCYACLTSKIKRAGLKPIFGEQGNSPFYFDKKRNTIITANN